VLLGCLRNFPIIVDALSSDADGNPHHHFRFDETECPCCTLLKEYSINDKVLDQVCAIVDGADSVSELLPPPEAAGLDIICRGLVKVLGDDLKALEIGAIIFDAFYVQLKEQG
jgi:hypothetical protein